MEIGSNDGRYFLFFVCFFHLTLLEYAVLAMILLLTDLDRFDSDVLYLFTSVSLHVCRNRLTINTYRRLIIFLWGYALFHMRHVSRGPILST